MKLTYAKLKGVWPGLCENVYGVDSYGDPVATMTSFGDLMILLGGGGCLPPDPSNNCGAVQNRDALLEMAKAIDGALPAESQALVAPNAELIALLAQMVDFFSHEELPAQHGMWKITRDDMLNRAAAIIEKSKGEGDGDV